MKLISATAATLVLVPSFVQASDGARVSPSASFFGLYGLFWIAGIVGSGYALGKRGNSISGWRVSRVVRKEY